MTTEQEVRYAGDCVEALIDLTTSFPELNNLKTFLDENIEGIIASPASTRLEYTRSHLGGWAQQTLNVCSNLISLYNAYSSPKDCSLRSLVKLGLIHDLGKVNDIVKNGQEAVQYYVENTSEWHREKLGQMYNINTQFANVSLLALTLKMCEKLQLSLTVREYNALLSLQPKQSGFVNEDVVPVDNSWLNTILQQAIKAACLKGKNSTRPVDMTEEIETIKKIKETFVGVSGRVL